MLALIGAVALCVYGIDQLTKFLVVNGLPEGRPVPVLGPVLQWFFVRNPGAAFSFAEGQTWIFTCFSALMAVVIVIAARRVHSARWAAVFGLVLGGVLGNLTDRLVRPPSFGVGHVIDFISTPWLIPAIYNVADMGVVFGMIFFVLLNLFDVGFDGVRGRHRKPADGAGDDAPEPAAPADAGTPAPAVTGEADAVRGHEDREGER